MRRFETLVDSLAANRGDAIIASLAATPQLRARVDFTDPYYRAPARFVSRRDAVLPEIRPEYLEGKKVGADRRLRARGVSEGDVHRRRDRRLSQRRRAARWRCGAARSTSSSATRSRWRSGSTAPIPPIAARSAAGPFVESRYFGEGIGIAVRKGNDLLRQALNWALFRIWEKGRYTDLWLRYFSVSPF